MRRCKCRFVLEPDDVFCMNCGADVEPSAESPPPPPAAEPVQPTVGADALVASAPAHEAPLPVVPEAPRRPLPEVAVPTETVILPAVPQQFAVDRCPNCGAPPASFEDTGWCLKCGAPAKLGLRDDFFIRVSDRVAARSHIGIKHHRNEDYVNVGTVESNSGTISWFVVCDGVSRSTNPQRASEQAAAAAGAVLRAAAIEGEAPSEALLRDAVNAAQKAVCQVLPEQTAPADYGPPATTFVAAYVSGSKAWLAWCGDARAYLITGVDADFSARLLTRDHTVLNELVDQGRTLEQAYLECPVSERHALVQCLGDYGEHEGDFHPAFAEVSLQAAVALVGCSDGVWNDMHPMETTDAGAFAAMYSESRTSALTFVKAAVAQASGADNNTCAAIFL